MPFTFQEYMRISGWEPGVGTFFFGSDSLRRFGGGEMVLLIADILLDLARMWSGFGWMLRRFVCRLVSSMLAAFAWPSRCRHDYVILLQHNLLPYHAVQSGSASLAFQAYRLALSSCHRCFDSTRIIWIRQRHTRPERLGRSRVDRLAERWDRAE